MGAGGDLREVLAPDIVWHLPRTNPMGTPIWGLDAVLVMLGRGVDLYDPANMRFEVHRLIADEGAVAVRMTFHTTTAAGKPHDGEYQLQFACEATLNMAKQPEILELMRQANFMYFDILHKQC